MVKMSVRYIESGSRLLADLEGGVGVVGVTITSTRSKACWKSRWTSVRTFWAFP